MTTGLKDSAKVSIFQLHSERKIAKTILLLIESPSIVNRLLNPNPLNSHVFAPVWCKQKPLQITVRRSVFRHVRPNERIEASTIETSSS